MCKSAFILSVLFLCATFTTAAPAFPDSEAPPKPRKIGLVLSGGGARGAAHIGVLKVLEREGIPIDCIAGTSFGALIGGLYALGYSASEIEKIFTSQDWNRLLSDAPERRLSSLFERRNFRYQGQLSFVGFSPELPSGLFSGQKMIEVLDTLTTKRMIDAGYDFDRLRIPFRAVATDLLTGQKYVFKGGRMTEALRASVAIPMIFTPVDKDGMLLVDGGLTDNLPADIARDMGADFIIAVDVTSPMLKKTEVHNFFDVFDQSVSLMMRQNIDSNLKLVDFTIQPRLDPFTYRSYGEIRAIEQRGEQEAERCVAALKGRLGDVVGRHPPPVPPPSEPPVVASIAFRGLNRVPSQQLQGDIRSRAGETVDPQVLNGDIGRLYATRLFENVDYSIDPLEGNRYRLTYLLTEAAIHTLGASIRYDRDYKFVALAEFTARQVFGTPSTLTLSSQFGGLDEHSLSLRYVYPHAAAFYLEPKVHYSRLDRLDIRNEQQVDTFTDKRIGGQLLLGGTFFKRLDVAAGYREDDVTIDGGADPNHQEGSLRLAGLTLRVHRDSLDSQEFARSGMLFRFQADKRTEGLGSDVSNSKWQAGIARYFPVSEKSTVGVNAVAGYSRGTIPFYDRFYSGGFSFSELGPQNLIGFSRDELPARQMAIAAAGYRWQVFSHPLSFARRGFLFGVYNIAAMSDQPAAPYDFHYFNGGGIGFAVDTMLGPARITLGWGSGGRFNLYLSMGPSF